MPTDRYDKLDWTDMELDTEDLLRTILQELRELRSEVERLKPEPVFYDRDLNLAWAVVNGKKQDHEQAQVPKAHQ